MRYHSWHCSCFQWRRLSTNMYNINYSPSHNIITHTSLTLTGKHNNTITTIIIIWFIYMLSGSQWRIISVGMSRVTARRHNPTIQSRFQPAFKCTNGNSYVRNDIVRNDIVTKTIALCRRVYVGRCRMIGVQPITARIAIWTLALLQLADSRSKNTSVKACPNK